MPSSSNKTTNNTMSDDQKIKKVAVGLSGGVDSTVAAFLLKEQGYQLHGVFLECYKTPGCRVEDDRKDALDVALRLGITFEVIDLKREYKQRVLDLYFEELRAGRTPNPDIACNSEIKFGLFYEWAMQKGFDAVATGHYADIRMIDSKNQKNQEKLGLFQPADSHKDQTYFLYRLRQDQLDHVLFPLGNLKKREVRELAEKNGFRTASKPDSQGICFIGEMNVNEFIKDELGENPGEVVDVHGDVIGRHDGLWFYTIGQRHGFQLDGKVRSLKGEWRHILPPLYVIQKDAKQNRLVVGFGADGHASRFMLSDLHFIDEVDGDALEAISDQDQLFVRIRHTGELYPCKAELFDGVDGDAEVGKKKILVDLTAAIKGISPGQHGVLYLKSGLCLGGGVIDSAFS